MDAYLKKYCKKHEVSREEALTHATVREVGRYYDEIQIQLSCDTRGVLDGGDNPERARDRDDGERGEGNDSDEDRE